METRILPHDMSFNVDGRPELQRAIECRLRELGVNYWPIPRDRMITRSIVVSARENTFSRVVNFDVGGHTLSDLYDMPKLNTITLGNGEPTKVSASVFERIMDILHSA
jgi:hypothetical protein